MLSTALHPMAKRVHEGKKVRSFSCLAAGCVTMRAKKEPFIGLYESAETKAP